ncbi:MAG: phytanoyl-CoA dioxygenase family protein [Pseudomonadota bacterium]
MGAALSNDDVARYWADGFLGPIDVMAPAEAAALRRDLETIETRHGPIHFVVKPHLIMTAADRIVRHRAVLDAVEAILGPDILLWDSGFVIKEPKTEAFVSWHQDQTYWGLDSEDGVVSAWVALSPATEQSGCMRMVPGSHRGGKRAHAETFETDNVLSRGQTVTIGADEPVVSCPLQPGQMSLHHGWVLHASQPNQSDDRRIGLAINYIRADVRQSMLEHDTAMLVRGRDRWGLYELETPPSSDFAPDALALQARVAKARGAEINVGADDYKLANA